MNNRYVIIMAGGIGSRFWPLSRNEKPKQFIDILGSGETLLQQTFKRFLSICPAENIIIITNEEHKKLVSEQLEIRADRILSEPFRKNTAPCVAYGTFIIQNENPNALIAVVPADHVIEKEEEFRRTINRGYEFAASEEVLITIGIKPDKPETGYGYIHADLSNPVHGFENLFRVKSFTEKPELSVAETFIGSGDYFWNAGIFIWSAASVSSAMEKYIPEIYQPFKDGLPLPGKVTGEDYIRKIFSSFPNISIDYGVLEKASNVYVLCADIGWSDLGTWSSLYGHSKTDQNQNAVISGIAFSHECHGNIISLPGTKIALIEGLEDYIIVDTNDALLIIRKREEQKIKQYLEEIRLKGNNT